MRMNCPAIDFAHTNSSTPFARILIFVTPPSCMMAARNTAEIRPNLKLVCKELGTVKHKYFDIGVQLGVPIHELKLFEKENSPLSSVVGYWLGANAVDVPVTWGSVVEALNDVGEIGLANTISKKYCKAEKPRKANVEPDSGDLAQCTKEKPRFDTAAIAEYDAKINLENPPQKGTPKYDELQKHCEEVEIILHTVNDNENRAALTYMKSPSEGRESNGVQNFPYVGMVVGVFAKKKVVLIQTDPGDNCEKMVKRAISYFPSAQYILAVGVCYGFDRKKLLLGDVLVSTQISDLKNLKYKADGTIEDRGERKNVADFLSDVFCKRCTFSPPFKVTDTRDAKVYAGTFLSYPVLMDNKSERDKFHAAAAPAIGGEMEGGVLMKLETEKPTIKGVIIIKGVVDYGDGTKDKEWQFTTAMAAFQYTETKLKSVNIPED